MASTFHFWILIVIDNSVEQVWIKLVSAKINYCIGVVYRPPTSQIHEFLETVEETLMYVIPICDEVIFSGDININLIDAESSNTRNFLSILDTFQLRQLINEPTRITANCASLIDVMVCSQGIRITSSGVQGGLQL